MIVSRVDLGRSISALVGLQTPMTAQAFGLAAPPRKALLQSQRGHDQFLKRRRTQTDLKPVPSHGEGGFDRNIPPSDDDNNRWGDDEARDREPETDELNHPDNWGADPGLHLVIEAAQKQLQDKS